jgi:hypothetical protein
VAPRKLHHVLTDCRRTVSDCRNLAADAHAWSLPGSRPHISKKHRDWMIEVAYLRSFLALEAFLEESFILFSLGHRPPRGRAPHRFTFPPNRRAAEEWILPEDSRSRPHASWDASAVRGRARRFFKNGAPFEMALGAKQTALQDARTIRNRIAHDSASAEERFQGLVRRALGSVPSGLTVGSFLDSDVPGAAPRQSFLDHYLDIIDLIVTQIVPPA